ncbi:MAG: TolC family protein [Gemmatimonadetes bacterium]|nr:TolC family protein [Gemmatimonadota bacterium]
MSDITLRWWTVLIAAALAGPSHASAQRPVAPTMTLQDAISLAQQRGLSARSARGARNAARSRDALFNTQYLPSLSIGGQMPQYLRSITPVVQPDGNTLYRAVQQTQSALTANIVQRLPWTNTTLNVSSSLSQVQVKGATGITTWSSTPLSFGISQPLLRANAQRWDRAQQELRATSAERRYLEAMEDVALNVTNAFFDLHSATLGLANATANAATNDTLFTLNKGRFEVGRIGENDLLQSELALLRARSALDAARTTYERAVSQFRIVVNLPPDAPVAIAATAQVPMVPMDTARAAREARRNSSTMSDAELAEVAAERAVREARWNSGAGGTLQASYGYNATASRAPDAYKNLLDAQQLTVSVSMPVWQWGAHRSQVRAAAADRESAAATSERTRAQLDHDARFAALQLAQAGRGLAIAAKSDTVAAKRFEVAYNRYVIGKIAIDNLYLAQNEKNDALNGYVQALRTYWLAYYQLRRTTLYDFVNGVAIR